MQERGHDRPDDGDGVDDGPGDHRRGVDGAGPAVAETAELDALVAELAEVTTAMSALQAREIEILAAAARLADAQTARLATHDSMKREMPWRSIAAEFAMATRVNDRTMQRRLNDALQLTRTFPAAVDALSHGRISRAHAMVLLDAGAHLTDPIARGRFEDALLARAEETSPTRLRDEARRLAEHLHPQSMSERHGHALRTRAVWVTDLHDGMSQLGALLPTTYAHAVLDRLTRQARAVQSASRAGDGDAAASTAADTPERADAANVGDGAHTGAADTRAADTGVACPVDPAHAGGPIRPVEPAVRDERTLDQVRADLFTDLLLTGAPAVDPTTGEAMPGGLGAIRASVQVTVPVLTLAGRDDNGAELDGRSPIDPETARRLAAEATGWDRVMTHPVTGRVLAVDRYRPGEALTRLLAARDRRCRFPGCRMPARRCDVDHTIDHALGGPTSHDNLAHLCKRHHTLKHATEWTVRQHPDGTLEWTSPTGRTALDHPPRVAFVPDGGPAPF